MCYLKLYTYYRKQIKYIIVLALNKLGLHFYFNGLIPNCKTNFQSKLTSYIHEKMFNKNQFLSDSKNKFGLINKQYRPVSSKNIIQVYLHFLYFYNN